MLDPKKNEKIAPQVWRNSQLSLAKYYGSININGVIYILDSCTDFLVREDIFKQKSVDAKKRTSKQLKLF
jgi:hypothetical protein